MKSPTVALLLALLALLALPACGPTSRVPPGDAPPSFSKRDYVGLSKRAAIGKAWSAGLPFRVIEEDGRLLPFTKDLRPERLNFTVQQGVITQVTRG